MYSLVTNLANKTMWGCLTIERMYKAITVEEHNMSGGLGSAVAEVLMGEGCTNVKMKRMALPDVYVSMFVNEKVYLAASNLTDKAYTLVLKDNWRDRVTGTVSNTFTIESGKICFLIKE